MPLASIIGVVLIAVAVNVVAQSSFSPRGMWCGGNQLIAEGAIQASRVKGLVEDGAGSVFPNAWVQLQIKGQPEVLLNMQVDDKGRFKVPKLRPGGYWLGVTCNGFNLHYWDLTVKPGSGTKFLHVVLTPGT
jgi:hypothetical protein